MTLCKCGCGAELAPDKRGRALVWARGHSHRGKKHSPEWSARQSSGLKSAWSDESKFKTMRHQSPELVARRLAKFGGVMPPMTPERRAKISAALTGRKLSSEHRAASSKGWFSKGQVGAPERLRELSAESEAKRRKSISEQRVGCHNYGRAARDRLDHFNALHWIVRDNRGVIHEFDNLQSWARANEHRFLPDDRSESKLPLWLRAVGGFNDMQRTDGKGSHQWKGWTLVSVLERKVTGAPDLMSRAV